MIISTLADGHGRLQHQAYVKRFLPHLAGKSRQPRRSEVIRRGNPQVTPALRWFETLFRGQPPERVERPG
jgi:hypothetical protein